MGRAPTLGASDIDGVPFRAIGLLAERCGSYCWLESRLFALTGSRASDPSTGEDEVPDAEVRVLLHEMSGRHASFATQWRDRLPVRAGLDAEALIVPPPGGAAAALDLVQSEPDLVLVVKALREDLLPRLLETYDQHLAQASPVSEAPVRAVLESVVLSIRREMEEARMLLRRLSAGLSGIAEVTAVSVEIQRVLGSDTGVFPAARAS